MGFLDTLFGGGAEDKARDQAIATLQQYQGQSLGALKDAYGQSTGYGQQMVSAYAPVQALGQKYGGATDLQLDALGVNGPAGTARAQQAMQATPGYGAGIEAVLRRRGASYMGDSGNTDQDLINYATNSVYQPWLTGVSNAAGMGANALATAAGGQASGYGTLAGLANQYGQNQSNVYGNVAQGTIAANNMAAAGEAAGAKNLLGAGLGLLSAAIPGGGSIAGSLFSKGLSGLGNLFQSSAPKDFVG